MDNNEVKLNPGQAAFWKRPERLRLLAGGRGSGKSAVGALEALRMVQERPGKPGLIVGPTYGHLLRSTLPEWQRWAQPYIVDTNKAERWYKLRTGSKVWWVSLDDMDSVRGMSVNWLWGDELAVVRDRMAWLVLLATLRVNPDPKGWITTTPRGQSHWLFEDFCQNGKPGLHWHGFASVYENAANLDPNYIASLEASYFGPFREQELLGKFVAGFGTLALREWFGIVDEAPDTTKRVRYWDLAATAKKAAKTDPDYLAGGLVSRDRDVLVIEDMVREQLDPGGVDRKLQQTADLDGTIRIGIEQEPGASGKILIKHYQKLLTGHYVQGVRPTGDKVARSMPWLAKAKEGKVKLLRGPWNKAFLDEVESWPVGSHDDQIDAVSGAAGMLASMGMYIAAPQSHAERPEEPAETPEPEQQRYGRLTRRRAVPWQVRGTLPLDTRGR
jgi:predicted phage terminase large subunit-like protein